MKRSVLAAMAVLSLVVGLWAPSALGQAVYGSILGTVTDPTGAAVNGAKVSVTSQAKNVTTTATTNDSGNYAVTHLIPDVYVIRIEAQGFKVLEFKDIIVQADTGARVDGQFQVGGSSETVEVTSEAPQLKTDRADVSVEFNSKQLSELPIFNRNFQSLELLTPGTQVIEGWSHAATENPQGSKQIFVNGQHFSGTGYSLDGTDNQDAILGIIIVNPSLDAVTETKMTTQNYDAEFGKALAGILTAQTKSGSNAVHGSGYFYDLDPVNPAVNPFSGSPQPNSWKQFGGSVGGHIIKNKLFYFGNLEMTRRTEGTSFLVTVPTMKVRNTCLAPNPTSCDLSDYLTANLGGGAGQVFNPWQGNSTTPPTYSARVAYPGNIIPFTDTVVGGVTLPGLQDYDPTGVAEKILGLLPAPNATGTNNGTVNNYSGSGSGSFNDYQYTGRVDYAVNQKLNIFGRYTHAHFKLSGAPVFGTAIGGPGTGPLGLAGQSLIQNYSLATGFDYTLSSSLLTDFRFGYFRYNPHSTKFDASTAAATALGLPGLNTSDPSTGGLPAMVFDQTVGTSTLGSGSDGIGEGLNIGRCNCPLTEREQGLQFVNNWTKIIGNHQFKFGGDLRHANNLRVPSDANRTGILNFNHAGTSNGNTGGVDLATFLFGETTAFNRYVGSSTELTAMEAQNRYFFYGQDTWRATTKLTINYGLRWEFYGPESVNGKGNGGFAVLPEGVIRVAGYGGIGMNGDTNKNYKLIAPRLGVAYEINPKTVVRMGYGRSFDIGVFGSLFGHTVTQNLPVLANQTINSPTNDNKTPAFNFISAGPTPNSFPVIPSNGILPLFGPCAAGSTGTCNALNVSPHIRPDHLVAPTVDAWNVTVQRQLTNKTSLELGYVGNHGSHVFKGNGNSYNPNQATVVGFQPSNSTTPGLSFNARSPYNTAFSTPYTDQNGVTTTVVCCSGYGFGYNGSDGTNKYNAINVKLDHRTSNGLTLTAFYTYAKAYDNDGSYQPDLNQGWGRQDFNRDSVFVLTSLYELPIGRGKQFMGNISRGADLLIGGWQWNTTFTMGSGLPFSPGYNNCNFDRDTGPCRPSQNGTFITGSGAFNNQTRQVTYFTPVGTSLCDSPYVNPTTLKADCPSSSNPLVPQLVAQSGPFADPGIAHFGNVQRNAYTGPGELMSDMSIFKNFSITERVKAQFQAEFFNVFNHPVYALPGNTCIDCSGAGVITGLQADLQMRQIQFGFRVTF
ncbi:MAG TPA: TonB-dependent receptor [Candidatus Sulfotelmatobacter sp.]|nr:TonB-dependent receptor [Candidatus Sulfotelmatobacter sp.]